MSRIFMRSRRHNDVENRDSARATPLWIDGDRDDLVAVIERVNYVKPVRRVSALERILGQEADDKDVYRDAATYLDSSG